MREKENELIIDPDEVNDIFLDCLYQDNECVESVPEDAVIVEGIVNKFRFHPVRLEEKRTKVSELLKALPHEFRKSGGGGWSFLNSCKQENGVQWTSSRNRMEELLCIGIGLGVVECYTPREMWGILPEGMPYYVINM